MTDLQYACLRAAAANEQRPVTIREMREWAESRMDKRFQDGPVQKAALKMMESGSLTRSEISHPEGRKELVMAFAITASGTNDIQSFNRFVEAWYGPFDEPPPP